MLQTRIGFWCFRGQAAIYRLILSFMLIAASLSLPSKAMAQLKSGGSVSQVIEIDSFGDANCKMALKLPTDAFTAVRGENFNTRLFLRRLGWEHVPASIQNAKVAYDDDASEIQIEWKMRGFAIKRRGIWTAPVMELIRCYDCLNQLNLWSRPMAKSRMIRLEPVTAQEVLVIESVDHGHSDLVVSTHPLASLDYPATAVTRIKFPENTKNVRLNGERTHIHFESEKSKIDADDNGVGEFAFEQKSIKPSSDSIDIRAETKPRIMSSLCKSYGTPRAQTLWLARFSLQNKTKQNIYALRVRAKVSHGISTDWAPIQYTDEVQPNQTFVATFSPILDPQALAQFQGMQRANIIIEYQYTDSRGKVFGECFQKPIEILSRNEAIWSQFSNDEKVGFQDQFNMVPLIVASMTTCDDPIVQMVAGRVSQTDGNCNARSDEGAIQFLRNLHAFSAYNLNYQTPPGLLVNHNPGQNIKYARDVLRNRAGTCIDLAILHASVCEAIGLEPIIFVMPGHAFPGVKLPESGKVLPIEATSLKGTFEAALKEGQSNLATLVEKGVGYVVSIRALRNDGVYPLDLERVSESALDNWGIRFSPYAPNAATTSVQQPVNPPTQTQGTDSNGIDRQPAIRNSNETSAVRPTNQSTTQGAAQRTTQTVSQSSPITSATSNQNDFELRFSNACLALSNGNNRLAIQLFEKLKVEQPNHAMILNNLAYARVLEGNNPKLALTEVNRAIQLGARSDHHYFLDTKACILFQLGHIDSAVQVQNQSIALGMENGADDEFFRDALEHQALFLQSQYSNQTDEDWEDEYDDEEDDVSQLTMRLGRMMLKINNHN